MSTEIAQKIGKVIELLRSIQQEMMFENVSSVVFPEHRKALIEKRICLVCEEPILPDEKDVRKLHARCRKEQLASRIPDNQLVSLGLLAPEDPSGRKPLNRLEKAMAQRRAENVPSYDLSKGKPTAKEAIKAIDALEASKNQKQRKTKKREPE